MTPKALERGCFAFLATQTALPVGLIGDCPFLRPTELPGAGGQQPEGGSFSRC